MKKDSKKLEVKVFLFLFGAELNTFLKKTPWDKAFAILLLHVEWEINYKISKTVLFQKKFQASDAVESSWN